MALFLRHLRPMSTRNAEVYEVYRKLEYLKELGFLAMPGEHPPLDLVIEMFNTTSVILDDLMRLCPRMMAERDAHARISAMQADIVMETDGDALGALIGLMLGPAMFVLVCGDD